MPNIYFFTGSKMAGCNYRSITWIIIVRILGLGLFLFLLYIANHLSFFTDNPLNYQVILFLNNNVWLIILMSIVFLFGEMFNALIFPFNLPAPLFNASGSVLLVAFLFRIFAMVDILLDENIFQIFNRISFLVYPLVFMIVLFGGYIAILTRLSRKDKNRLEQTGYMQATFEDKLGKTGKQLTWEDVGEEFKQAIYDLLSLVRHAIDNKKDR